MKNLVIGGSGCIGRNLTERLKKNGEQVYCTTKGFEAAEILGWEPEIIFYCAGEMYKEDNMFSANVQLLYQVLMATIDIPYSKFIYVGAGAEYGIVPNPRKENVDRINPGDLYEATKGCGTLLCQGIARSKGKPIIIVRPFSLYGKYEQQRRLIPTIFRYLNGPVDGVGLSIDPAPMHDWTYIDDMIDALILLGEAPIIYGDIVNIGTGVQVSNETLLKTFCKVCGEVSYSTAPRMRTRDQECYLPDMTHAKSQYGIECKTTLAEGLKKYSGEWKSKYEK
jgi:nucleoside-diphosphate-sugar epimerase